MMKKTTNPDSTINRSECLKFYQSLDGIIETILSKLKFHQIPVEDEFDAYRKFDTINNRGVGLANQDLIKTRIFAVLYSKFNAQKGITILSQDDLIKKLDKYERKWAAIRERINPKNKSDYALEKFLHHLIVIKYGSGTERVGDIFDSITELLEKKEPDDLIDEIDNWSKTFQKIRNPQSKDWDGKDMPEIEWYLNTIRQHHSEICYHIILAKL